MSINFNPGPKIASLLDQQQWGDLQGAWSASGLTGSGSKGDAERWKVVNSGTTAISTAYLRTTTETLWSIGQTYNVIDWTKRIVLHFVVRATGTANGFSRISMGKTTGDGIGNLARKGIGIRIDNTALKGQTHDGSSLTTVDLSTTLTSARAYRLSIISDGSGNMEWFVDGASKGSSSGGPSALGTAGESAIQLEVDNGGDAALQFLQIANAKIYVEQ